MESGRSVVPGMGFSPPAPLLIFKQERGEFASLYPVVQSSSTGGEQANERRLRGVPSSKRS